MNFEKTNLACFDVDETLTFTDSFLLFLRYTTSPFGFAVKMLSVGPYFLLYVLRVISRDSVKNHLLSAFLKDMPFSKYTELCKGFSQKIYPIIARDDGLLRIKSHQGVGDKVIMVSASLEDYLVPWAQSLGIDAVIATKMEVLNNRLTGKMSGENCRAANKVKRIRELYPDAEIIAAYGDSAGDKEMLAAAKTPNYRKLIDEPRNAKAIIRSLYWGRGLS